MFTGRANLAAVAAAGQKRSAATVLRPPLKLPGRNRRRGRQCASARRASSTTSPAITLPSLQATG
eukprot:12690962-Alexandrium_andersonii.AAC.1